jgi:predicted O-linked N-acetylglucosamine transferase (SPINDLY family)
LHAPSWSTLEIRHQILPLLSHLDSEKCTFLCYTAASTEQDLFPATVNYHGLNTSSPEELLARVRQDQVDILIELGGLAPGHPFTAMHARGAPVQMAYLGHMATTGIRQVDYQIADEIICPPALAKYHTEKILYLPGGYTCFDFTGGIPPNQTPRCRLDDRITFGCLAPSSLLNQSILRHWATILKNTPHSRLLFSNASMAASDCRHYLRSFFTQYDLPPESLLLLPRDQETIPDYLWDQIDIHLDPSPHSYPLGLAAALFHGIPAVTLLGPTMAGRTGASLLRYAGLGEHVAMNPEEYVRVAMHLARDPQKLQTWRQTLPTQLFQQGLTDMRMFAKTFQDTLVTTWAEPVRPGRV